MRLWHKDFPVNFVRFLRTHIWVTASVLQQLLVFYFVIIYAWQLSSGGKSVVRKKNSFKYLKI